MAQAHVERKLTAILSTEVVGFSRLMGRDEVWTAQTLDVSRDVIRTQVVQHGGRVVDAVGDNLLADFPSALEAVRCAVAVQQVFAGGNTPSPPDQRMLWRIGVNVGDVLIRGQEIAGDGVNIAARLEGLAPPGGICISGTVYDQVAGKLALGYAFLGEHPMKNIAKPVRVYRVLLEPDAVGRTVMAVSAVAREPQPIVCFIDDDPKEIEIIQHVFGQDLHIVAGTRWSQALAELTALGRHPNLFLLDLYFPVGRDSTLEERETMARLKAEVETAQKKLSDYLAAIGQDRAGGLQLLEQVRSVYRHVPVVFYTRKGTLDDVTACLEAGAVAVLRKPQPETLDAQRDLYTQLEAAALAHRNTLLSKFEALSSSGGLLRKVVKVARYIWKNWGNF
jgi:class 3 adenylate cyclase/CheY-like chemotaxis protein